MSVLHAGYAQHRDSDQSPPTPLTLRHMQGERARLLQPNAFLVGPGCVLS